MESTCTYCGNKPYRASYKYCSNRCQLEYQYSEYIKKWKLGLVDGGRGIKTRNISGHLKRYFLEKYGDKCSRCGWSERHPQTNKVPLELDHIDGDSENNAENNLRLLCPNCHSLTPSFKNLNKGNGRGWRKRKYIKAA